MAFPLDRIRGSIPPLFTPFNNGAVDYDTYAGMIEYYLEVTKGLSTPWMIYHIPGRAAVSVTVDTVKELKDESPTFVGMKHASPDLDLVSDCFAAVGLDFKIFVGLEELSFPMM